MNEKKLSEEDFKKWFNYFSLKFESGNSIPVHQAIVTKEEFEIIKDKFIELNIIEVEI